MSERISAWGVLFGGLTAMLPALIGGCAASDDSQSMAPPVTGVPTAGTFGAAGTSGAAGVGASGVGGAPVAGAAGIAGVGGIAGTGGGTAGSAAGTGGAGAGAGAGEGGAGGEAGASGMMAGTGGSGGTGGTPATGPAPVLPEIQGECPQFTDGSTIAVAGHGSIAIAAGEPGQGGPLLFYWHGTGGSAQEAMRTLPSDVRNDIISSGGIIAAFNGRESSGTGRDCSGTGAHNMADFDAADQIAACAVRDHGIDPRRIYSTGCSAGGLQSGCMAMMRSSYLAAAAPNSGGIVGRPGWQDENSPAIFTMHGGPSDMVIVTFSDTSRALDMSAKTQGSFVVNCDHGGGHCRAPAELQSAAWQFMKDHPWGVADSPWSGGIPSGVPSYCSIF